MPHQMLNVVIEVFEPFPYPLPAYPTFGHPFMSPRCMVNEKVGSLHGICIIEYNIYIQLVKRTSLHDKSADIFKHAGSVETIWMASSSLILLLLSQELNPNSKLYPQSHEYSSSESYVDTNN